MKSSINIKIGGQAGEGIKATGLILAKIFSRNGFNIFSYDEYPSLIRGGHNTYQMHASLNQVFSQIFQVDILIALDKQSLHLHQKELSKNSLILFDPDEFEPNIKTQAKLIPIPWAKLALSTGGSSIMANMVSLGATLKLIGLEQQKLNDLIKEKFSDKGEKIVSANQKSAQAGQKYIENKFPQLKINLKVPDIFENKIVVLGNEALAAGAIASGVKYYAAYPMTPASSILHYLAAKAKDFNIVVNHVENELAAINTVIGASASGLRAMTGTSGGGFSLMTEGLGMCGMAEVPAVIVLAMRPGPASGMPTWTGQGDLRFAIHASQDEFPRIILTPGNAFETFDLTKKAFELAEKYQMPVILLTDKVLAESHQSGKPFPSENKNQRFGFVKNIKQPYLRYQLLPSGVSPRPFLGQAGGASLIANSYEHGEDSLVSEESSDKVAQNNKRLQKLKSVLTHLWPLPVYGNKQAKLTMVGFGSTLGPAREALKNLPQVNYLHFNYVWPFPVKQVQSILKNSHQLICLEGNSMGQLEGIIFEQTGIKMTASFRKFNGRPIYPEEIINFVKGL